MTHEEMQRTIQFIVEHEAKFSVEIDRINETLARHTEAIAKLKDPTVGCSKSPAPSSATKPQQRPKWLKLGLR